MHKQVLSPRCTFLTSTKSLKEEHSSLVNEKLCIDSTLEENKDIMEWDICPILKMEIENLKGQLIHITTSHNIVYIVLKDK